MVIYLMSKTHPEETIQFNNLKVNNSTHLKKLRFHPYYYQGRKGSLYLDEKRTIIKIAKIDKKDEKLILTLSGKKTGNRIELKCFWDDLEFDYYSIQNPHTWKIIFPKK